MQADPRHLTVIAVSEVRSAEQGTEYLDCETSLGRVVIRGSPHSRWNIGVVQAEELPFEAVMFCVPGEGEDSVLWVPEETRLFFPAI